MLDFNVRYAIKQNLRRFHLDPDPPDPRRALWALEIDEEPPSEVSAREWSLGVYNQGSEGSCGGFATRNLREAEHYARTGVALSFSPRSAYDPAKVDDEIADPDEDYRQQSGTTLAALAEAQHHWGIAPWEVWPYFEGDKDSATPKIMRERWKAMRPYRIRAYRSLTDTTANADELLRAIKYAIWKHQGVLLGVIVREGWFAVDATGVISFEGAALGGHAMWLCEYNDRVQVAGAENSWGPDWGAGGYGYIRYADLVNPRNLMGAYMFEV